MKRSSLRNGLVRVAVAAALVAFVAAPAGAATKIRTLRCAFEGTVKFSPAITMLPAAGAFTGTGMAACQRQPAPPGALSGPITLSGETSALDTCAGGAGSGTLTATLTDTDGSVTVFTARFTLLRDGLEVNGPLTGTGNDTGLGTVAFGLIPPAKQNCVDTPLKRATAAGVLTFTGGIR